MRLAITDSGLGGLAICAGIERRLRAAGAARPVHLVYVNAWPDESFGYNSLPDMPARAAMFDRALAAIDALAPDRLVIACNTLSILYDLTDHGRRAPFPVTGIVEPGVALFHEALTARPRSGVVLVGTRTTIESGLHRQRLVRLGVDSHRIGSAPCHGLAAAIEMDPGAAEVFDRIDHCAEAAARAAPDGEPLHAGLCCTHYGYVAEVIRTALARHTGRQVLALDPNDRLVDLVVAAITAAPGDTAESGEEAAGLARAAGPPARTGVAPRRETVKGTAAGPAPAAGRPAVTVEVISKVTLDDRRRHALARLVEPVSEATAQALASYAHVPELF